MTVKLKTFVFAVVALFSASFAQADCAFTGAGSVKILSNDFAAINAVNAAAMECNSSSLSVTANQTKEHQDIQVEALTANPANFNAVVIANSSIVPLMTGGLIRPLNDLVAKYGSHLAPSQLVTIDGNIMAIAFMANAQHLMYRTDLLKAAGVAAPKTYEEILAAADAIRSAGLMQYPLTGTYKAGWNLGEEFVNLYIGLGGEFFESGTAVVAVNNDKGVAALNMMKQLTSYMHPDYLTVDSAIASPHLTQGQAAMGNIWGSRGSFVLDPAEQVGAVTGNMEFASAATIAGGSTPATTLWWDGFTLATNQTDEEAATAFQVMLEGADGEMVRANNDLAVWLDPAYDPQPASAGVFASAAAGAQSYPMLPYMGILHTAFGSNIADFLQGKESAEQTLTDITDAYTAGAKEAGFL
jgi:ABC-type glycerol-3-phosphate transport system substrate-binding protein